MDPIDEAQKIDNGWEWDCLVAERDALQARVAELETALVWCGGSSDFCPGGIAREGWMKVCAPCFNNRNRNCPSARPSKGGNLNTNDILTKHPELAYAVEALIHSAKFHHDIANLALWDARREIQFRESVESGLDLDTCSIEELDAEINRIPMVEDTFPPGHLGDYMLQVRAERDRYRKALDEIAGIGSTTAILNANEGLHRARTIAISAIK